MSAVAYEFVASVVAMAVLLERCLYSQDNNTLTIWKNLHVENSVENGYNSW